MRKNPTLNHAMAFVICLTLLLFAGSALSGQAASQPVTNKPISGKTTSNTTPLPSTSAPAMEYQQVDKPPVKKLDIPEYDLAGQLSDVSFEKRGKFKHSKDKISFNVSLKNHGTRRISPGKIIRIKIRLINAATDTILEENVVGNSSEEFALESQHWVVTTPRRSVWFKLGESPAPETLNDLKLIVDIDPNNSYKEAQRHRGNNRCIASW